MSDSVTPKNTRISQFITPGTNKPGVLDQSNLSRVIPRQFSTGTMRGTQRIGYGGVEIDSSNNTITLNGTPGTAQQTVLSGSGLTSTNPDGSASGIGAIPDTTPQEYGFFSTDSSGVVIMKIVFGTKYVYNPSDSYVNVTQDGLLPDGSGGFVVAKEGYNVADAYDG